MSDLKDRLAEAWAEDLSERLSEPVFAGRRRGNVEPPFTVLVVRRMEQTTPASGTWMAECRLVVVCNKESAGGKRQAVRLCNVFRALEETLQPSVDEERGVKLYGFSVERVEEARAEKVFSDVVFLVAGVGEFEAEA